MLGIKGKGTRGRNWGVTQLIWQEFRQF